MDENAFREYNSFAFHRACQAERSGSYHKARALLSDINIEKVSDPEVEEYVGCCKDICSFCIDYGIPYEAGSDYGRILRSMDYTKAAGKVVIDLFNPGGALKAARSGIEAARLIAGLPGWIQTGQKLRTRYP